jgi:hypothetical protein
LRWCAVSPPQLRSCSPTRPPCQDGQGFFTPCLNTTLHPPASALDSQTQCAWYIYARTRVPQRLSSTLESNPGVHVSSLIRTCNAKKANREKTTRFTATCVTHHCVTTPHCLGATCLRACLSVSTRITFVSTTPLSNAATFCAYTASGSCPAGVHPARPVNQLPCEELLPLRTNVPNASNHVVQLQQQDQRCINNKTNVVSDYFSNRAGCRTLANCCPCSRNCVCSRT